MNDFRFVYSKPDAHLASRVKKRIGSLLSTVTGHPWLSIIIVIVVAITTTILYQRLILGWREWAVWTGFGKYSPELSANGTPIQRSKTLWDWLELLIVPAVLAVAAILFNKSERDTDREIASQRIKVEHEIALDRQRETNLQAYIDRMADYLLDGDLLRAVNDPAKPIRNVAQTLTTTVLRTLDKDRRDIVFQFLRDSGLAESILIGANFRKIDLSGTNISLANLSEANLEGANLSNAILLKTKVNKANLLLANLTDAILEGADLSESYLEKANLVDAYMPEVNLDGSHLNWAKLNNAILDGATIREASLRKADLSGASLNETNLSKSDLKSVDFTGAVLGGAVFVESYLVAAIFRDATIIDANFHAANADGADFTGAVIKNTNFSETRLYLAKTSSDGVYQSKSLEEAILESNPPSLEDFDIDIKIDED